MSERAKSIARGKRIRADFNKLSYRALGNIARAKPPGKESDLSKQKRRIAKEITREGVRKDLGSWKQESQLREAKMGKKKGKTDIKRVYATRARSLYN